MEKSKGFKSGEDESHSSDEIKHDTYEKDMESRKEFFRQLGLPRHEVYEWAKRSMDMPTFDIEFYRNRRHQIRSKRIGQNSVDRQILGEIKEEYRKALKEAKQDNHESRRSRSLDHSRNSTSLYSNHSRTDRSRSPRQYVHSRNSAHRTPTPPILNESLEQFKDIEFRQISNDSSRKVTTEHSFRNPPFEFENDELYHRRLLPNAQRYLEATEHSSNNVQRHNSEENNRGQLGNFGRQGNFDEEWREQPRFKRYATDLETQRHYSIAREQHREEDLRDMNEVGNKYGSINNEYNKFMQQIDHENFRDKGQLELDITTQEQFQSINNTGFQAHNARMQQGANFGHHAERSATSEYQNSLEHSRQYLYRAQQNFPSSLELHQDSRLRTGGPSCSLSEPQYGLENYNESRQQYFQKSSNEDIYSYRNCSNIDEKLRQKLKIPSLIFLKRPSFWTEWWKQNRWIEKVFLRIKELDFDLFAHIRLNTDHLDEMPPSKNRLTKILKLCEETIVNSFNNSNDEYIENAYGFLKSTVIIHRCLQLKNTKRVSNKSRSRLNSLSRLLNRAQMIRYYLSIIETWKSVYACVEDLPSENRTEASHILNNELFNWLVGLAFGEIKRFCRPYINPLPKEEQLKKLFDTVSKTSTDNSAVANMFFLHGYSKPQKVFFEKMEICKQYLNRKPYLNSKAVRKFLVARILLADPAWDTHLDAGIRQEKNELLLKLDKNPAVHIVYENMLNKYLQSKDRFDYLISIHESLKLYKDLKEKSFFKSFVNSPDVRYICKFILLERMNKYGTFVDPTINEQQCEVITLDESDYGEHDESYFGDEVEENAGKYGFCIKTFKVNVNEKFFINVCQSNEIPAPKDVNEEELTAIIQSEDVGSFRVPMSISDPRLTKDKSNNPVDVCDIAVNPKFFVKCQKSTLFKEFFLAIVAEALNDKYNVQLRIDRAIVLNNRKFIGTLVPHRIRTADVKNALKNSYEILSQTEKDTLKCLEEAYQSSGTSRKQLVQEISEKEFSKLKELSNSLPADANVSKMKKEISQPDPNSPEYMLRVKLLNEHVVEMQAEFYLPKCVSSNEINLDIGEDRILLESRKRGYFFDKFVNYRLKQEFAKAIFDKSNKMLQVRVPVYPVD